jgi:poly-beta-hydroxyalkanoate depolymerase
MFRLGKDYEKPEFGITSTTINKQVVEIVQETTVIKPFASYCTLKSITNKRSAKIKAAHSIAGCATLRAPFNPAARYGSWLIAAS